MIGGEVVRFAGNIRWAGVAALIFALLLPAAAFAQDTGIDEDALFGGSSSAGQEDGSALDENDLFGGSSDEDDLFGGGDDMIEDLPDPGEGSEDGTSDAYTEFLTSDAVQIGGSLGSSLSTSWSWADAWDGNFALNEGNEQLGIDLGGSVYINARPSSDLRIFLKAKTAYPFEDNSEIFEFYSDVNWDEKVFFRFGKQTVNWGVGYFYSPADFISLVPIDIDDPEAEREGPVAIKVSVPVGLNEFDAYIIGDETVRKLEELGVAGRATFFIAPVEFALGAGYQQDRPLRLMTTVRFPWRDWNFFAEGRLSFGRQGKVITDPGIFDPVSGDPIPLNEPVYEADDDTYFSATAGFLYLKSDLLESSVDLNVIAQYYFKGEGYSDNDLYSNPFFSFAALYGLENGEIDPELIQNLGQHYTALSIGLSQLFVDDLSASLFWQAAWTDMSGLIGPSVSYRFFDGLSMTAGITASYGGENSEYGSFLLNQFGDLKATLTLNLGGGRY
jgi:hypothetical protein